ncbi:MAG: SagB/ThcOx family dehydrogenase [Bacteroidia bacterium]|nr:SagB/ThcOx family dehydrogenase [Bacteroidia bacterium]
MKRSLLSSSVAFVLLAFGFLQNISSQDIVLPAPDKTGGKPLMLALNERQTIRTFTADNLTNQQLSDLLWAAWGYNRPAEKKRTAPSSRNVQEIDVYAVLQTGLYLYVAETHTLKQIHNRDIRALCGTQDFVGTAPLNLIYVADMAKFGKKEGDEIKDSELLSPYVNTGFIAQNVYLYCASANLGCVVRGMVPKDKLAPEMGLRSNQRIILGHTIGVPVK